MTLYFACGCFWIVGSGLACCATHEAPYRQVEDILPLTLVRIEKKDDVVDVENEAAMDTAWHRDTHEAD